MRQLFGLTPDETTFLREAAEHYCATRCPLRCGEGSCPLSTWREGADGGAVERVCKAAPAAWRERFYGTRAIGQSCFAAGLSPGAAARPRLYRRPNGAASDGGSL
jgi:hypothetical protein